MHYLRLYIVVSQELHCLPNCLDVFMIRVIGCFLVSEIAKRIACMRLFIVVLQELHCLLQCLLLLLWCVH